MNKRTDFMQKIEIQGGNNLSGEIFISGAKNSAVALIPAAILCNEETTIYFKHNAISLNNTISTI